MVRQAAKVLVLLPPFAAVLLTLGTEALLTARRHKTMVRGVALLVGAAMAAETGSFPRTGVCLLEPAQGAYQAVARDARTRGETPRALAVVLWPGESHYSSVYLYYAAQHRLRMVNGYRPLVPAGYVDEVFQRFQSANSGWLDAEQVEALREMGVGYLLLHEDLFPEKVSPFPVAHTLAGLSRNPRLALLAADGPVWAFRLRKTPRGPGPADAAQIPCAHYFPARRWEAEGGYHDEGQVRSGTGATGGAYVSLHRVGASVAFPSTDVPPVPNPRVMFRARGEAVLSVCCDGSAPSPTQLLRVSDPGWSWYELSCGTLPTPLRLQPSLSLVDGTVDLDLALLAAGEPLALEPGETLRMPAACFFHAGHTRRGEGSVYLQRRWDPEGVVWYGPKMPLAVGDYRVELSFSAGPGPSLRVGTLDVRWPDGRVGPSIAVERGREASLPFRQQDNVPVFFAFSFDRTADLKLEHAILERSR
jgi:hypothetical protein